MNATDVLNALSGSGIAATTTADGAVLVALPNRPAVVVRIGDYNGGRIGDTVGFYAETVLANPDGVDRCLICAAALVDNTCATHGGEATDGYVYASNVDLPEYEDGADLDCLVEAITAETKAA